MDSRSPRSGRMADGRRPSDEIFGPDERDPQGVERELGDFTTDLTVLRLIPLSILVGLLGALAALVLDNLIGLFTNLAYFQEWSTELREPFERSISWWSVPIPVIGGLIVGLMARYGSEGIRGHGIPEAIETILLGGSKSQPRLTVLKPLSSAISIGTGGPFGAEGPIIMTAGAIGSVLSQYFKLTAIERRSLLVAGAAAGLSAVFGTPVAAVLLGIELLVFEWRPRSMVVISLASGVAATARIAMANAGMLEQAPLFPVDLRIVPGAPTLFGALAMGLMAAACAWVLTRAVSGAETLFNRLTIHWAWWPAIGGVFVGLGGLIEPRALGVGYGSLSDALAGELALQTLLSLLVVKLVIWSIGLGSGTSGGVLAPILLMGASAGGALGQILPGGTVGAWALLGMAAVLAGTLRSPLTAIIFALEVTHDIDMLLPLLIATMIAHLASVLLLKRSLLTEKIARRGFHVLQEYSVGAIDALFVRDSMETDVITVSPELTVDDVYQAFRKNPKARAQRLLPVVDETQRLMGVLPWTDVLERAAAGKQDKKVAAVMKRDLVVAFPDETLREVADRLAERRFTAAPVVDRGGGREIRGVITSFNLLEGREHMLQEERHRERVLSLRPLARLSRTSSTKPAAPARTRTGPNPNPDSED